METHSETTFFQKRRNLVLSMNKQRRQMLFEKSRKLFEEKQKNNKNQSDFEQEKPLQIEQLQHQLDTMKMIDQKQTSNYKNTSKSKKVNHAEKMKKKIAKIFQVQDWLNQIPANFSQFLITAKPDGHRVLVTIEQNIAIVRNKRGSILTNIKLKTGNFDGTILQGYVLDEKNVEKILISDVICWKSNYFTANQFQFRINWLKANLIPHYLSNKCTFSLIEYFYTDKKNLKHIYNDKLAYPKDGLLFIHKDSFYEHGHNPNYLRWKDKFSSKYLFDGMQDIENQDGLIMATGIMKGDDTIYTEDGIKIYQFEEGVSKKWKGKIKFTFKHLQMKEENGQAIVSCHQVQPIKFGDKNRVYADPLSKLIFCHKVRHNQLGINQILHFFNQKDKETQMVKQQI